MRKQLAWLLRRLRLFWKLLVPSVVVTLVLGVGGMFVLVRYLSAQTQESLDDRLFRHSVSAQAQIRDEVTTLRDSARLLASIEGMDQAAGRRDAVAVERLLAGVAAVRTDLDLLVVTDAGANPLVDLRRSEARWSRGPAAAWTSDPTVRATLAAGTAGGMRIGTSALSGEAMIVVAAPIEAQGVVGAVVAGATLRPVAEEISRRAQAGVAVYGPAGDLLASSGGAIVPPRARDLAPPAPVRRVLTVGGERIAVTSTAVEVEGLRDVTVAVSLPAAPVFAAVRGAGLLLALVFLLAMLAVIGLGAMVSRAVVAQVTRLNDTNRALGRGDLSARAPVLGDDELGELARGFNVMAEQLQASYQELEIRVADRTKELARLYQEMSAASQARVDFFAALSHELRTPLFVIAGYGELMLDQEEPSGEGWREEFGRTIHESAQHLLERVNDLLELVRLESGTVKLELGPVAVHEVTDGIGRMISALAQRAELRLDVDVPDDLPLVLADRDRLREILLNLVSNAIKYTPSGGEVAIRAVPGPGSVRISVADTGVGIPLDDQERIFDPFYRARGTRTQRGEKSTGLGLAITKHLVEAHGGEISLTSRVGAGSTFTLSLIEAGVDDIGAPSDGMTEGASPQSRRSRRVSAGVRVS